MNSPPSELKHVTLYYHLLVHDFLIEVHDYPHLHTFQLLFTPCVKCLHLLRTLGLRVRQLVGFSFHGLQSIPMLTSKVLF